jgi:hypothetical protein
MLAITYKKITKIKGAKWGTPKKINNNTEGRCAFQEKAVLRELIHCCELIRGPLAPESSVLLILPCHNLKSISCLDLIILGQWL